MKFLRQLFLQDVGLKVTSLLLAFLLWFQNAGRETIQRVVPAAVEFVNLPAELVISNDYTRQVDVTIRRPSTQRNSDSEVAVVIDMADSRPGTEVVSLTEANIQAAFGVEVEGINPSRIRLELEKTLYKSVEIEPEAVGQPAEGFELVEIRLTPSEALISGPESRVKALLKAQTAPIDITGRSEGFTTRVSLDLSDPMLRIDTEASTQAVVVIEELRRDFLLGTFTVTVEPADQRARLSPRSVRVTGSVPLSFEGDIDQALFSVIVRIPDEGDPPEVGTTLDLALEVVIPEEYQAVFRVQEVTPAVVSVTLR